MIVIQDLTPVSYQPIEGLSTSGLLIDARTQWHNARVANAANVNVQLIENRALEAATLAGYQSWPDSTMPPLLSDVPELIQAWSDGYGKAAEQNRFTG
jgi:hypothetical protein